MTNFESLKETLARYGQEHLLRFWDELSESERKLLIQDIQELNLEEVQSFFKRATASLDESAAKLDDRLQPVPESTFMSISRTSKEQLKIYEEEGELCKNLAKLWSPVAFLIEINVIYGLSLLFQASLKSPTVALEFCLWPAGKELVWVSLIQKACTTLDCHRTNHFFVFREKE